MNRIMTWLTGVFLVLLGHGVALAALPPKPPALSADQKPYIAYGIALILIAGVAVAAFKGSKRTHLD